MQRYTRLAPDAATNVDLASRVVRYTFSDESIGRDGHIVLADAWRTDNFEANPVFLWQHLDEVPPIGRVFDLHTEARKLVGAVKYAQSDLAETIFDLVRDGFLNATSTSWQPIEYKPRSGGGVIFSDVDLLEISQVSVPALPTALAQAGARGINLRPLADWAARAIDIGNRKTIPRPMLEAIYRAARIPTRRSDSNDQAAIERRRVQARAIATSGERNQQRWISAQMARAGREWLANYVRAGGSVPAATSDSKTNEARKHLARAVKHHRDLAEHHEDHAKHFKELRTQQHALTSTLKELGFGRNEEVQRALKESERCTRALHKTHVDATDSAESASDALDQGLECLADGSELAE
jgi:hypothetical protein